MVQPATHVATTGSRLADRTCGRTKPAGGSKVFRRHSRTAAADDGRGDASADSRGPTKGNMAETSQISMNTLKHGDTMKLLIHIHDHLCTVVPSIYFWF